MKTTESSVESRGEGWAGEIFQRRASDVEAQESQDPQGEWKGVVKIVVTFETQQSHGTIGLVA